MWSWDICADTCAICRNSLNEPSIEYQVCTISSIIYYYLCILVLVLFILVTYPYILYTLSCRLIHPQTMRMVCLLHSEHVDMYFTSIVFKDG